MNPRHYAIISAFVLGGIIGGLLTVGTIFLKDIGKGFSQWGAMVLDSDADGAGLWELRSTLPRRIARCLFYVPRGRIVLLHGFIKKTPKTPTEDKALALKRRDAHTQAEKA